MSKHTEGPWVFAEHENEEYGDLDFCSFTIRQNYEGLHIATVISDCVDEHEANARLIAAAPELYESAINAQKLLRTLYHEARDRLAKSLILERLNELDASIKKARAGA